MKFTVTAQFLGYKVDKRIFKDQHGKDVLKESYFGHFLQEGEGTFDMKMDGKVASMCEKGKIHTFNVSKSEFNNKTYFRITGLVK